MITFKKTVSTDEVVEAVADRIIDALQAGKRVVWLVSGGSLIPLEVAVMGRVAAHECGGLVIVQADERYAGPGHASSNWQQLLEAGFTTGSAYAVPVLAGLGLAETTQRYDALLRTVLEAESVMSIGFFGIGADGHTAGILPDSPALQSTDMVTSYQGPDYTRVTVTPRVIAALDIVIAYAAGETKHLALKQLHDDLPVAKQPAQLLKQVREAYIYHG